MKNYFVLFKSGVSDVVQYSSKSLAKIKEKEKRGSVYLIRDASGEEIERYKAIRESKVL